MGLTRSIATPMSTPSEQREVDSHELCIASRESVQYARVLLDLSRAAINESVNTLRRADAVISRSKRHLVGVLAALADLLTESPLAALADSLAELPL